MLQVRFYTPINIDVFNVFGSYRGYKMGYEKMSPQQFSYKRSLGVSQGFRNILKTVQRGMEKLSVLSFY